ATAGPDGSGRGERHRPRGGLRAPHATSSLLRRGRCRHGARARLPGRPGDRGRGPPCRRPARRSTADPAARRPLRHPDELPVPSSRSRLRLPGGRRVVLTVVEGLIGELREVGLPVSTTEAIDAVRCLRHVDLGNRHDVRSALATTLVKSERHRAAFDTIFELYFAAPPETPDQPDVDVPATDETSVDAPTHDRPTSGLRAPGPGRSRFDMLTDEELRELVIRALMNDDDLILQP